MKKKISNKKYALILIPDADIALKYLDTEQLKRFEWGADNIIHDVDQQETLDCYQIYFYVKIDHKNSFRIYSQNFIAAKAELLGCTPIEGDVWEEILSTFSERQRKEIDPARKYLVFHIIDYNGIKRYLVDPTNFKGYSLDTMSDGVHCDYCLANSTLEEYRNMMSNPDLKTVTREELEQMEIEYKDSLCKPFEEISEQRYYELFNCLPPLRLRTNSFFISEAYCDSIHLFCFAHNGKYYSALRNIRLSNAELDKEIEQFINN